MIHRSTALVALGIGSAMLFGFGAKSALLPGQEHKLQAILFLSTDCPVAMKYTPRIQALVRQYEPKGVRFEALFPNDLETEESIRAYAADRGYTFPIKLDRGARQARRLGVTIVPTLVVLDGNGNRVYVGAIDDHKDPTLVKERFAEGALDALLAGSRPPKAQTEPFGCVLMPSEEAPAVDVVNYAEHVKPILDRACIKCHSPGGVSPFSLVGYDNARKWAPMIERVTASRRMPPWKAVHGYGVFQNENRLTASEVETLANWSKAGAPRGEAAKEPKTPTLTHGEWPDGEPDLILAPEKPYSIAADGPDDYRHFVIKTNFKETKWIKSMAVKPGNPKVVHHVIAFLDERGASHRLDGKDGQPGYSSFGSPGFLPTGSLGGWAPGNNPIATPEGIAYELKPGTTIVLQVHYHKTGKPETDLTKIGLTFADEPIKKPMQLAWIADIFLNIPAGEAAYKRTFRFPILSDVTLYGLMPHMHLLGKEMRADVEFPDGSKRPLIYVKDWDFNWQLNYTLVEPIKIPRGSRIILEAVYDNSAGNPNNPNNPPKDVRWGEQTTDEMMLLVAAVTVDSGDRRIGGIFR